MNKKTICIDFDGVIHSYDRGWQDGVIYGDVTPGFFEWAHEANKRFKLVVYSSRSKEPKMLNAMRWWLWDKAATWLSKRRKAPFAEELTAWFEFSAEKPAAWLTIDDRGVTFRGDWSAPELSLDAIDAFKPWNVR